MTSSTALGNFPAFKAGSSGYARQNNNPGLTQTLALRPDLVRTIGQVGKRAAQRNTPRKSSRKCA